MPFIKGYFKKIIKYRIVMILMVIIISSVGLVIFFTILGFFPDLPLSKDLASMMGILAVLFSSLVALFLPFILISVENDRKSVKKEEIRVIIKNAVQKICRFCISQYDKEKNSPKDTIEEDQQMKVIEPIEFLNMYKTEALKMGIVLSSGWQEVIGENVHIFIFIGDKLEIKLNSPSYGKVIQAIMKYNGEYVESENVITENFLIESLKYKI